MKVIAFTGPSGTGKSYRSVMVARRRGADGIIDDGLLISHGKVIAGTSAKKEATRIASVKHALFMKDAYAAEITKALNESGLSCVMILGTSENMAKKIAAKLKLPKISEFIHIEDVASEEEMELAHEMRTNQGQHVIPVPTFEIKKDFSGYFLHPLRRLQRNLDSEDPTEPDKSIVRPTFSYMGDYTISDKVIIAIAIHETEKFSEVAKIVNINLRKTTHGVHIDMTLAVKYGCDINEVCRDIQRAVRYNIEMYTSINARRVHIFVRNIVTD